MKFNEWRELELKDVCSYSKEKIAIEQVDLDNYISTENMLVEKGGKTQSSGLPSAKTVSKYMPGNVLISNIRPYFKKIWYGDRVGGASNDVLIFQNSPLIEPKFLYYFLSQDKFFEFMTGTSKGTKMPRGDKDAIMKYSIFLPSLEEQKAIANILSSLDEKIELNNQMNKTLEEMAQVLFKRWFVDFEFPNEDGEPYKSSGGEMVDSELGMIPKGWMKSTLGDLMSIGSGKRPPKKSAILNDDFVIPLIGASSVMGYVPEPLFDEPILVIGRVGTHGVIQRFNSKVWPSDNTLVIKAFYYEYVYQMLKLIDYSAINRGSTQPLITQSDVKAFNIIKPSIDIMKKYEEITGKLFKQVECNNNQNTILESSRNNLLSKLMSGEIRVTDLQN